MELMDRDCDERPPMKQWDVGILSLLVRRLIDWSRYFLFVCEKVDAFRSKNKNEMNGTSHLYIYYAHILQVCIFPIRRTVL